MGEKKRELEEEELIQIDMDNYALLVDEFGLKIVKELMALLEHYRKKPFESYKKKKWLDKYQKFVTFYNLAYESESEKPEPLKEYPKVMTIKDYERYKPPKNFIIQDLVYPCEIAMNYGDSNSYKSLHMLYKALCISSGKKYLGKFKVKKCPVLILSAENSKRTDKDRIFKLMRGLRIRKRDNPLYFLPRSECKNILDEDFKDNVIDIIELHKIKCVFLDTINPLTPETDDNKARDVIKVFREFLDVLSDDYGVHVEFLHHTDKRGNQFLGSTKWKGNSDAVTKIHRNELDTKFKLYNEKNRDGEQNVLEIGVESFEKETRFTLLGEEEPQIHRKKKKKNKVEQVIEALGKGITDKKEIMESVGCGEATYKRGLADFNKLKNG